MRFGKIDRFIWFGAGPLLLESAISLRADGYDVAVFTSPRHVQQATTSDGTSLEVALCRAGIDCVSTVDINACPELRERVSDSTIGIAMGPAWIFRAEVCRLFGQCLVNFMGIDLPRYRGGAHYTWQILQQNRRGCCNLQLITTAVDAGAVIKHHEYHFPHSARIPEDYFRAAAIEERAFLNEFLEDVKADRELREEPLQEKFSQYLPYLNTLRQGWLDWTWTVEELDRFVCAFDSPYPGASTYLDGGRVFLHESRVEYGEGPFHPFMAGIVYRRQPGALYVAARGGTLVVRKLTDASGNDITEAPKVGRRFYTPRAELDAALEFRAIYDGTGLRERRS